jgi:hypothetical protein
MWLGFNTFRKKSPPNSRTTLLAAFVGRRDRHPGYADMLRIQLAIAAAAR